MPYKIKDCKKCFFCNVNHFVSLWDGCYVVSYPGKKTGFFRTMPIQDHFFTDPPAMGMPRDVSKIFIELTHPHHPSSMTHVV